MEKVNIIITSGGTSEKIDNVRKITNSSSGKLGMTIANTLVTQYASSINKIFYICAKTSYKPNHPKIEIIEIESTNDLQQAITDLLTNQTINYFIHSMAVSDYTLDYVTTIQKLTTEITNNPNQSFENIIKNNTNFFRDNKISSSEDNLIIKLKPTPKIISLIKDLSPNTYLVGFKLLDHVSEKHLIEVALKLKEKNKCDLVVANDLNNIRNNNHKAFIIKDKNNYLIANNKEDIANKLIKEMFK